MKEILILAAMELEEQAILKRGDFKIHAISEKWRLPVNRAVFRDIQVDVVRCGIGCVNAGICVALTAEKQNVDEILLLGVAGALDASLRVGDLVIPESVVQHDYIFTHPERAVPVLPGQLFFFGQGAVLPEYLMRTDSALNRRLIEQLGAMPDMHVRSGLMLSGNEFVGTPERKRQLGEMYGASVVDMEAAGVAQVATELNIPFSVAKTVADTVDPESGIGQEYLNFAEHAAHNAARVLDALMR